VLGEEGPAEAGEADQSQGDEEAHPRHRRRPVDSALEFAEVGVDDRGRTRDAATKRVL
jgi:hypothetical protein